MLLLSITLVTFFICNVLSFSFAPTKPFTAKRCRNLTVRSFGLDHTWQSYKSKHLLPLLHCNTDEQHLDLEESDGKVISSSGGRSEVVVDVGEYGGTRRSATTTARINNLYRRIEETMEFAGFESPMYASGKSTIITLLVLYSIKLLRNKFLLKGQSKLNEFQPNWGHVVTSKEEEVNLHAYECKKCGATIFIAKGREFRFYNPFVECTNCGAKGKENFVDRRKEIVDEVDDGTFIYESFVDYNMSKRAEKKATEQKKKIEEEQVKKQAAEEAASAQGSVDDGTDYVDAVVEDRVEKEVFFERVKTPEPAKPIAKKESSRPTPKTDLDELDMDG